MSCNVSVSSVCPPYLQMMLANLAKLDEEFLVTLLMTTHASTTVATAPSTDSVGDDGVVVVVAVRVGNTPLPPLFFLDNAGRLFRLLRSIPVVILVLACLD